MRDQSLWTWHLTAGAVILVLLGLHLLNQHLDGVVRIFNPNPGDPTDWTNVMARSKEAAFLVIYVLLLGAALFHGFYGLRNILFELNPALGLRHAITAVLIIGGIGLFALGTWTAVSSYQLAQSVPVAQAL